jgi:hypothetical protein
MIEWIKEDFGHHGVARPRVTDGGDVVRILRVSAHLVNKQSRKADKGWSSSWWLGVGLTTPNSKH